MALYNLNNNVKLDDILPPSMQILDIEKNMIKITDILVHPEHIGNSTLWFQKCSIEYDLVIPIDIAAAVSMGVVALDVVISPDRPPTTVGANASNISSNKFTCTIPLFSEIGSTMDIGETDIKTFINKVKRSRTIQIPKDFKRETNTKTQSGPMARFNKASNETLISDVLSATGMNLDTGLPGSSNRTYGSKSILSEKDYYIKPPKIISDGKNVSNISVVKLKQDILEKEHAEGRYEIGSKSHVIETLLEPDYSVNQSQDKIYYLEYVSTVIPIRRVIRLSNKTLDPSENLKISVTPILSESVTTRGGVKKVFKVKSRSGDVSEILIPVGVPDITITGCSATQMSVLIRKNDPSLKKACLSISYFNPTNPDQIIPPLTKNIDLEKRSVVAEHLTGLQNIFPLRPRLTFFTQDDQENIVKSKTIEIKSFSSSISYMMPNVKLHKDNLNITALSTKAGVHLKFEGLIDKCIKFLIYREDLSIGKNVEGRIKKIATFNITGENYLTDTQVVPGHVYRYYGVYQRLCPAMPHILAENEYDNRPRSHGQGVKGITTHRTTREAIVKYKKPVKLSGLQSSEPVITRIEDRPAISFKLMTSNNNVKVKFEDVLKYATSPENDPGSDNDKLLKEPVWSGIVERINRVSGDEQVVGVFFLDSQGQATIQDREVLSLSTSEKYTYKIKVCKPNIAALYNKKIPVKKENQGTSRGKNYIDAIKYTSDNFLKNGIIENAVKVSEDYVNIIKNFDTGERIYVDFDPFPNKDDDVQQIKSMQVSAKAVSKGVNVQWNSPTALNNKVDAYLVYSVNGDSRQLIGSIKAMPNKNDYSYLDIDDRSFVRDYMHMFKAYSITPVHISGKLMGDTEPVTSLTSNITGVTTISKMIPFLEGSVLK